MLAAFQRALATLYVDADARARFDVDPAAYAAAFALDAVETDRLLAAGGRRLHAYADTLDRKRANEAARMLPLAARLAGPAFRRAFFAYARHSRLGAGEGRYRDDALAFAEGDAARRGAALPPVAAELLDYEAQWLRMWRDRAPVRWRAYARPIERIARAVAAGEQVDETLEPTLVLWSHRGADVVTVSRPIPRGIAAATFAELLARRPR